MSEWTRQEVLDFRNEIEAFAKAKGLSVRFKKSTFGTHDLEMKAIFQKPTITSTGVSISPDQVNWNRYCGAFGLEESDWGKTFPSRSKLYTLKTIKPENRSYPIIATHGKYTYKFPVGQVLIALGKKAKPTPAVVPVTTSSPSEIMAKMKKPDEAPGEIVFGEPAMNAFSGLDAEPVQGEEIQSDGW
jgi:hypothetical protein